MKAAFITKPGPPEALTYGDTPTPETGPNQVLVKVGAVSVNPIDTYVRSGMVSMDLPTPYIVGSDLAGTVEAVGKEVAEFLPGDRVWAANQGRCGGQGTFAEYASVDASWLHRTPESVTDDTAAAIALVGITAHIGIVHRARLQRGETLFVNGGSGGIGSMVIQIAKALGARVITTAGSADRVERCRELGADQVVNYRTDDVAAAIRDFAPDGLNIYWETRREIDFETTVPLLAKRGRYIVMAGREARPVFPVGPFYVKDCELHGFAMFNYSASEQRTSGDDLNRWLAEGKLRANIDRVLPLSEAAAAHRLQEENTIGLAGTLAGKIVLNP
jgi:NADPH:quinone reductase